MEEALKWFVLTLAYYGTGIFFISRYWRRTRKRLPTLAMLAGLWLLAGWDVYFVYPWYGDYCTREENFAFNGVCPNESGEYDCSNFNLYFPEDATDKTCPFKIYRSNRRFLGLTFMDIEIVDTRCGKIVHRRSEKFVHTSLFGRYLPLFTWLLDGFSRDEYCRNEEQIKNIKEIIMRSH